MLNAHGRPATVALPPMHNFDQEPRREESEARLRTSVSSARPRSRSPSRSRREQPPTQPPYANYSTTSAGPNVPASQESHMRHETKQSLDPPLPSLRSVTGIGEALDTTRSSTRFGSHSSASLPPPQQSSYPNHQSPHSPHATRQVDASAHYERRSSYERPTHVTQYDAARPPPPAPAQQLQQQQHSNNRSYSLTRPESQTAPPPPQQYSSQPPPPPPPPASTERYQVPSAPTQREPHYYQPPPPQPMPPPERQYAPPEQPYSYGMPESQRMFTQPPPPQTATLAQQDSRQYPSARYEPAPPRRDEHLALSPQTNGKPYGESVKRHLDTFDLESSLNEIAESSRLLHEFSQHYRNKAHQTQRSGHLPGSTPNLGELEEMSKYSSRIHDSINRLHDVVLSQQAALAERSKDHMHNPPTTLESEDMTSSGTPAKEGFAGSELKKRRGRAAPPGRCHSCNRAETPEWRRGPDGARTLCNACGLHYAKLTRKMGNNKQHIGNSNLKPKSADGSPPRG